MSNVPETVRAAIAAAPISNVEWVPSESLDANDYNPNVVLTPEMRLLERSLLRTGWVQPVLASRPDRIIVDGFHRTAISRSSAELRKVYGGLVPVVFMDVDRPTAMVLTIRMNRAKGTHSALHMSTIVRELLDVHMMDPEEVAREIGATRDEVDLLRQDGVFKARNIAAHTYSRAWIPRESRLHGRG